MIYRGFKVDSVVVKSDEEGTSMVDIELRPGIVPRRVEFVVSETVAGFHWQEVGAECEATGVFRMIDHILTVREALSDVVGVAI